MFFLEALILIGVAIYYAMKPYNEHKRKMSEKEMIVRGLLNDPSNILKAVHEENIATPKSISAMTSLYLPQIVKEFPDFNYDEIKKRSENILLSYLRSIDQNKAEKLEGATPDLQNRLESYIAMQKDFGYEENFDMIKIHRTEIAKYLTTSGRRIITFQTALQCYHYTLGNGMVIDGSKEELYQTKFNVELIYIQDIDQVSEAEYKALGINCPNCGAPVKKLGYKNCEYCGSSIENINTKIWAFSSVMELK